MRQPMEILKSLADFLSIRDAPASCDLIFVLAGRPERKPYGWELLREGLAPRLILSVGRYEVRQTARQLAVPSLLELRDATPPGQRHFWIDFSGAQRRISVAHLKRSSTYWELRSVAQHLGPDLPRSMAIVSTSIHLRRVRFCCSRIPAFNKTHLIFLPVPEDKSSFVRMGWWNRAGHWSYILSEYAKLMSYLLLY
jgi:hypothetical protein